jgi:hypothetical protein
LLAPAAMTSETIASSAGTIPYQNFLALSMSLRPFRVHGLFESLNRSNRSLLER